MTSLTDRRHRQTRADIAEAAVRLFAGRGFEQTTMDDIAEAAGVSRRTVYRHFAQKEDLVFDQPRLWLEHFDDVVATRTEVETTCDICRRGVMSVAHLIEANRDALLAGWAVLLANPSLRGMLGRTQDEWHGRYVELIQPDLALDMDGLLRASIMAGTIVATTNALVAVWALDQPIAHMPTMTDAALELIDPLWPAATREVR